MQKMIEIEVNDLTFEEAIKFARDNISEEFEYGCDVVLVANDIEIHKKGIEDLYHSLPISVPFDKKLNDKINKIEKISILEINNKIYGKWVEICIQPFGTLYIVEKNKENDAN